jgi:signal transduction histidine kinase
MGDSQIPTVLAVDDDTTNLKVLRGTLESLECRILLARSGERAIEIATEQKPELVLLDVLMPGLNGFDTCDRLKAHSGTAGAVVIFLSALDDLEARLEGLQRGGVDYITKPFHADEILAKVRTHLQMVTLRKTLATRNRELSELNQKQNQLLGMAAHDLRTPLTAIMIAAQTLQKRKLPEEAEKELLDIVGSSSRHMQSLIEELLDMSSLQSSEVSVRPEAVQLAELIRERLALHSFAAETKKIGLVTDFEDLPPLNLDRSKVAQVIDNLLSNAIKYSWKESSVTIKLYSENKQAVMSVSDTGVGISPDGLEKIFEPFAKVGSRPTLGESSHGLGLAIVNNIVKGHGGEVSVSSTLNEGSTFYVKLPIPNQSLKSGLSPNS